MKKLYKSKNYKRYNEKRSKRALRNNIRIKAYRRNRNFSKNQSYSPYEITNKVKKSYKDQSHFFEAPLEFSLLNNTNQMLDFLNDVRKVFSERKRVKFDFKNITSLTPEAIAMFIAHLNDKDYTNNQHYSGNSPKKDEFAKMFKESGFYDYVASDIKTPEECFSKSVHRITEKKVEPTVAKMFAENSVNFSIKEGMIFRPLYEIIIECMANTKNHAGLDEEGKYNWWMFVFCDEKTKISHFTFIDLGVGIFESLNIGVYRKIVKLFTKDSNCTIMKDIIEGKVQSRTGKKERGKGLPLIYKHSKNKNIKNMYIISNNVKAYLDKVEITSLPYEFKGTLLYWEIHPSINNGGQLELWK